MIDRFTKLLLQKNKRRNFISKSTEGEIAQRHVADSLQLKSFIPLGTKQVVDLGTGGGFPGVVLAITMPRIKFIFVEKSPVKMDFLNQVIKECELNATVVSSLMEVSLNYSNPIFTSRAFKPLPELFFYISNVLDDAFTSITLSGATVQTQIDEAKKHFSFNVNLEPSQNKNGFTLVCSDVKPKNLHYDYIH